METNSDAYLSRSSFLLDIKRLPNNCGCPRVERMSWGGCECPFVRFQQGCGRRGSALVKSPSSPKFYSSLVSDLYLCTDACIYVIEENFI